MTFLPIVDRELRAASRRRVTYWNRLFVAFLGILVGTFILLMNFGTPPAQIGHDIFVGLSALAIIYCLLSGRGSTADCLSEEKREGTLGLLFLTDLTGYDVVLGKLTATSLNAFYGLLGVFPVLAIPILLGGVTNGEFWRMVLVLLDTFLFSLAIGIFASSLCRDLRNAMGLNFAVLFFFTGFLPVGYLLSLNSASVNPLVPFLYSSAFYPFYLSGDVAYTREPQNFWISLLVMHGLTWLLLFCASRIVPHAWQDQSSTAKPSVKTGWSQFWHFVSYGKAAKRNPFRKRMLDVNAFYWLAGRARLKPLHVWIFLVFISFWWFCGKVSAGNLWLDESINLAMAVLLNSTLKLWVAREAGHRLAEDKRIGALELLLSTPLGVSDIVRGQFLALRRQFLAPLVMVVIAELFLLKASLDHTMHSRHEVIAYWLVGIFLLMLDLTALALVSMAQSLSSKNQNQALGTTIFYILLLPWALFGMVDVAANTWAVLYSQTGWTPGWQFQLGAWGTLSLLVDIGFGFRAWWQLQNNMRHYAMQRFTAQSSNAVELHADSTTPKSSATMIPRETRISEKDHLLPGEFLRRFTLKKVLGMAGLMVVIAFFAFPRSVPTPAAVIVASGSLNDGPLRVFPCVKGAMFILPDGSLWRWAHTSRSLSTSVTPELYGTNRDWLQVEVGYVRCVGLKRDGTIWELRPGNTELELDRLDPGNDWISISSTGRRFFAIKRDGSIWGWGENLPTNWAAVRFTNESRAYPGVPWTPSGSVRSGTRTGTRSPETLYSPVLARGDTNLDWVALGARAGTTFGLRKNGTLWAWGQAFRNVGLAPPSPIQVCRETNWTAFSRSGFGLLVRNAAGELWDPLTGTPGADMDATSNCRLVFSNAPPDRVAFAMLQMPEAYEIRADGTLWRQPYLNLSQPAVGGTSNATQVGQRSDWVSLWGGDGTAYGLTSDGTLWMWGLDPSLEPMPDFASKLVMLRERMSSGFGPTRTSSGQVTVAQFQKEPRPLIQLKSTLAQP